MGKTVFHNNTKPYNYDILKKKHLKLIVKLGMKNKFNCYNMMHQLT